ncbi:MAG: dephospho-CoA kinase [Chryseolinea sp.]
MRRIVQIGITGGIGSGKSLVCRVFRCLEIPVYNADSHAKELMTTDGILISNIKKEFGELSYNTDGSLNRDYLSAAVFNDAEKLQTLNGLVHPRVAVNYNEWVRDHSHSQYVLKEAALLFEAGSYLQLDKVVVVTAPEKLRIARVRQRDPHRSEEQIKVIIVNQMPEEEKMKRADFTIVNDECTLLIPQVLKLHDLFLSMRS